MIVAALFLFAVYFGRGVLSLVVALTSFEPVTVLSAPAFQVTGVVAAVFGMAVLFLALQLQVRVVEEPYLQRVHGSSYAGYAAATGRFVPRVGPMDQQSSSLKGVS